MHSRSVSHSLNIPNLLYVPLLLSVAHCQWVICVLNVQSWKIYVIISLAFSLQSTALSHQTLNSLTYSPPPDIHSMIISGTFCATTFQLIQFWIAGRADEKYLMIPGTDLLNKSFYWSDSTDSVHWKELLFPLVNCLLVSVLNRWGAHVSMKVILGWEFAPTSLKPWLFAALSLAAESGSLYQVK